MSRLWMLGLVLTLAPRLVAGDAADQEPTYQGRPLDTWVGQLQSPEARARRQAAYALSQMGPEAKPAVPALTEALKDEEGEVRMLAAEALGRIGPGAAAAIP